MMVEDKLSQTANNQIWSSTTYLVQVPLDQLKVVWNPKIQQHQKRSNCNKHKTCIK